jgi:hypothetical protein
MDRLTRAQAWYGRLLSLYPAAYRRRFELEMRQTFRDLYLDNQLAPSIFWGSLAFDALGGAIQEQIVLSRSFSMKKFVSFSSSPSALYIGTGLMLPAALFFAIGTGLQIWPPPLLIGQLLQSHLRLMKFALITLPLLAISLNVAALIWRAIPARGRLLSLSFVKNNFLTLALIIVALGWLAVLFGHDTLGCAVQHLPLLHWHGFTQCALNH